MTAIEQLGLIVIGGYEQGDGGFWDRQGMLVARTTDGREAWKALLPSATGGPYEFERIVASPDGGRVFAAGTAHDGSWSVFHHDLLAAAFDAATGALLWSSTTDVSIIDAVHAVAISPDGTTLFLAGSTGGGGEGGMAPLVAAIDATTGETLWTRTFASRAGAWHSMRDLAAVDGALFATGSGGGPEPDFRTFSLDPATGETLWSATYDGPGAGADYVAALATDGSIVVVAGNSQALNEPWGDIAVAAYDAATGAQRWVARYAGPGLHYDGASDVVLHNGAALVTGLTHDLHYLFVPPIAAFPAPPLPITLAVSLDLGIILWTSVERGLDPLVGGHALAIAARDDRAYVVGTRQGTTGSAEPLVMAINVEDGSVAWRGVVPESPSTYESLRDVAVIGALVVAVGMGGGGEVRAASGPGGSDAGEPHADALTFAFSR